MQKYTIEQIGIDEYDKCNNIWDMKKCPFTEDFKKQILKSERLVFIYKINNKFIGEGDLVINNSDSDYFIPHKRIYVSRIIVKKEFRNKGIGSAILDLLTEKSKELGYSQMALGVDIDNYTALHLYRKKGFNNIIAECEDEYGKFYKLLKIINKEDKNEISNTIR